MKNSKKLNTEYKFFILNTLSLQQPQVEVKSLYTCFYSIHIDGLLISEHTQMIQQRTNSNSDGQIHQKLGTKHLVSFPNSLKLMVNHKSSQSQQEKNNTQHFQPWSLNEVADNWNEGHFQQLFLLYQSFGSNWKQIAAHMENKSRNYLKNKFYASMRKLVRKVNEISKSLNRKRKREVKVTSIMKALSTQKNITKNDDKFTAGNDLAQNIFFVAYALEKKDEVPDELLLDVLNRTLELTSICLPNKRQQSSICDKCHQAEQFEERLQEKDNINKVKEKANNNIPKEHSKALKHNRDQVRQERNVFSSFIEAQDQFSHMFNSEIPQLRIPIRFSPFLEQYEEIMGKSVLGFSREVANDYLDE